MRCYTSTATFEQLFRTARSMDSSTDSLGGTRMHGSYRMCGCSENASIVLQPTCDVGSEGSATVRTILHANVLLCVVECVPACLRACARACAVFPDILGSLMICMCNNIYTCRLAYVQL